MVLAIAYLILGLISSFVALVVDRKLYPNDSSARLWIFLGTVVGWPLVGTLAALVWLYVSLDTLSRRIAG